MHFKIRKIEVLFPKPQVHMPQVPYWKKCDTVNSVFWHIEEYKEIKKEEKRRVKILEAARQMPKDSVFYHDGTVEPGPYPHTDYHGERVFYYPDGQKIPQCPMSFVLRSK